MATRDDIPPELTLELGDNPTPSHFLAAARAFFGMVDEIAKGLGADHAGIQWAVHVKEGSNLLSMVPSPETARATVKQAYTTTTRALRAIQERKVEKSGMSDAALTHMKMLSELSVPNGAPPTVVRMWVTREPIDVTPLIADAIAEEQRTTYKDFGTFEGRLEAIQDHNGRLNLRVHDHLLHQVVKCAFHDSLLQKAFKLFRKRVEVTGLIHYRKNDQPVSIDVADIEGLPDDSELPTPADVRGILATRARK
jgi:hypothetical protein